MDRTSVRRVLLPALLLVAWAGSPPPLLAQDFDPSERLTMLEALQQRLAEPELDAETLVEVRSQAQSARTDASQCISRIGPEVRRLREEREILEEELPGESLDVPVDIWEQRLAVESQIQEANARLINCQRLQFRAEQLVILTDQRQSEISSQLLWRREGSAWQTLMALPEQASSWPEMAARALRFPQKDDGSPARLVWILAAVAAVSLGLGLLIRRQFVGWVTRLKADEGPPALKFLLPRPLAMHAPLLLLGLSALLVLAVTGEGLSLDLANVRVIVAILGFSFGLVLIDWSTGPLSPSAKIEGLIPDMVKPLRMRLRALVAVLCASFIVLGPLWLTSFPEMPEQPARIALTILLAAVLASILLLARKIEGIGGRYRIIRAFAMIAILAGALAELIGL